MYYLLHTIINNSFNLLQILILFRVIISWIPHDPHNHFIQMLYQVTDLILRPIRDILPVQSAGIDFSPILAFFFLGFAKKVLLMAV